MNEHCLIRTTIVAWIVLIFVPLGGFAYGKFLRNERYAIEDLACFHADPFHDSIPQHEFPWYLRIAGEDFGCGHVWLTHPTADEVDRVKRAFPEAEIVILP